MEIATTPIYLFTMGTENFKNYNYLKIWHFLRNLINLIFLFFFLLKINEKKAMYLKKINLKRNKKQKNSDKFQQISKTSIINTIFLDFTDLLLKTINRTVSWFV